MQNHGALLCSIRSHKIVWWLFEEIAKKMTAAGITDAVANRMIQCSGVIETRAIERSKDAFIKGPYNRKHSPFLLCIYMIHLLIQPPTVTQ